MFKFRPEIKKTLSPVAKLETLKGGGHNFHIFFKRIFFGKTSLKLIEKNKRGHAPPENFENLRCNGYFSAL